MSRRWTMVALLGMSVAWAVPVIKLEDLDTEDTAAVGSYIREVRAAPPEHYHISYDDEGEAEVGYNRKKEGKGKKGYQKFDSFHKKDGDSYAFEKQDSYGYDDDKEAKGHGHEHHDGAGAHSERKEKKVPKSDKYQEVPVDESESHSSSYDVSEGDEDDGSSEGPPPESAHNSSGYDEADSANYQLPGSYTYGQGDEYDF